MPESTATLPHRPEPWTRPPTCRTVIRTHRLEIRPWREEESDAAFQLVESCRESLRRTMSWVDRNRDPQACRRTIQHLASCHQDDQPEQLAYAIFDRESGEPCGGAGFHSFCFDTAQAQLGYWMEPARCGSRLTQEAARALIDHAFTIQDGGGLGLRRIEVRCAASNDASRSVAERLGLRREADLRAERWVEGVGWDDTLVFGVLVDEWALGAA